MIIRDEARDVTAIFDRTMKFCPHRDITADYLEYMIQKYEEDAITEESIREALEKCTSHCGHDIYNSQNIWKAYREFEIDEHADADSAGESSAVRVCFYLLNITSS